MKRILFLFSIISFTAISFGQINQRGIPFIKNFTPEAYEASTQNWAIAQDSRGVMYFGNNDDGVLEYDGKTWRKIPVPNKANVRSLAVDSQGTVYVGTYGDFGYLAPNESGEMRYHSLLPLLTDSIDAFADIWKTYFFNNKIYFFAQTYIFCYDGAKIKVIDIGPQSKYYNMFSFVSNNRFYIGSYKFGLLEVLDTNFTLAPGANFYEKKNIWAIIASSDSTSTVVTTQGLFNYNQKTGDSKLLENNQFYKLTLDDASPYFAIGLNDSEIGIAYVFGENYSYAKTTPAGFPVEVLNKAYGLQDETVTSLYQKPTTNGSSPLWLSLNSGISRAGIHSPLRRFGEESGIRGGILDVIKFNGTIFVATFSGVFYQTFDKNGFPQFNNLSEINTAAWSFFVFVDPKTKEERLLVGTSGAIYDIDKNYNVTNISETEGFKGVITHICYAIQQSLQDPTIVNLGVRGGLARMVWRNNTWQNLGMVIPESFKFVGEVRKIAEEKDGDIWLSTYINGIKRIEFKNNEISVSHFDTQNGLPDIKDVFVYKLNDSIVFATSDGLKRYNPQTNLFEPTGLFGSKSSSINYGVSRIVPFLDGYVISATENTSKKIELHSFSSDGNYEVSETQFKPISGKSPDALYTDNQGKLWIGISTDLVSFDPKVARNYDENFNVLIRRVTTKGDSVLFSGSYFTETPEGKKLVSLTQNPNQIPTLPFSLNSFVFDVAAPYFENEEHTVFSFLLEGNDKEWSKWSIDPKPIYTNVPEGSYIFKVKARNVFGVESSIAEYHFSITPPWYRSIVALIAYVLLLAGFIWAIVVLNTRRLIAEKERLEQIVKERTAEVVAQKEELEKQRDKIFEQNEEIKSSINYASRIQTALLTPVETLNDMFKDYFILFLPRDIVSGDFYWQTRLGNRKICVVADCTGHGVPGGFMSMLGMGFLTQITTKSENLSASQILDQLRAQIITSLHQTGKSGENKDGMDLALYIIDEDTGMLEFAGANNPLIILRDNEVIQIKGDKMPIGIHIKSDTPFTNNVMEYKKGDVLYTFSDGYVDQFGGPDLRKFMIKNLKDLLVEIHHKPMEEQRAILFQTIKNWQGETPRIDDIVLMGVRL